MELSVWLYAPAARTFITIYESANESSK